MSGKKEVKFMANAGTRHAKSKNAIPETLAPEQEMMAAGPDGGERLADINDQTVRSPDLVAEQFPTDALKHPSAKDVLMEEKLKLGNQQGVTPFGQLIAKDEDFKWLREKRETEAEANFMQWFATNFDGWSPAQKALARQYWPDFYAQRERLIDKKLDLMRDIARVKLHGPRNKEELQLLYALEAGFIDGSELDNLLHPETAAEAKNKEERQKRFGRGLLNPRARPRGDWGTRAREQNSKGIATGKLKGEPWKLGNDGGEGFSAYAPRLSSDPTSTEWEGQAQFRNLLNSVTGVTPAPLVDLGQ